MRGYAACQRAYDAREPADDVECDGGMVPERIYESQRMSASEVRRLRYAADAAREAYDDAREWCRHDDTEDARDVIGPLIRCSGCCRTVRYT